MAGCIFIKQGIVIQKILVGDGRVIFHQRQFAEIAASFVHIKDLLQDLQAFFRLGLHDLSLFHGESDLRDQIAVQAQRP